MGLFGSKKQADNGIDKQTMKFLEEADKIYIKALETRSIVLMKDHFSRKCCVNTGQLISANMAGRFFSNEKFRKTTWSFKELLMDGTAVYLKSVKFDKVKVSSLKISVSEDYTEEWHLLTIDGKLSVVDINIIEERLF